MLIGVALALCFYAVAHHANFDWIEVFSLTGV